MPTAPANGEQPANPASATSEKRPYAKPQLNRMGELRSLTQFYF